MQAHTYLNFPDGKTEEAFRFYAGAFGSELEMLTRFEDMPMPGFELPAEAAKRIMHVRLPMGDGAAIMGSDIIEGVNAPVVMGNNFYVSLHPETREEADHVFAALSEGGDVEMAMADAPWGDYYGSFTDKFGVQWMIDVMGESTP
ncbi:MAG: VOC family protein [Chloroflexota bacterium]